MREEGSGVERVRNAVDFHFIGGKVSNDEEQINKQSRRQLYFFLSFIAILQK